LRFILKRKLLRRSGHTIVEAHADIYAKAAVSPLSREHGVKIVHSKWQDALPVMLADGEVFDVIFFDTWIERCAPLIHASERTAL
jgi:hypothetical protein